MQRFFFHLQDGRFTPDLVGSELASLEDVRRHAVQLAASVLAAQNGPVWESIDWQITVIDEEGETVFSLNFHGHN